MAFLEFQVTIEINANLSENISENLPPASRTMKWLASGNVKHHTKFKMNKNHRKGESHLTTF
jgi:hypothetical protein